MRLCDARNVFRSRISQRFSTKKNFQPSIGTVIISPLPQSKGAENNNSSKILRKTNTQKDAAASKWEKDHTALFGVLRFWSYIICVC